MLSFFERVEGTATLDINLSKSGYIQKALGYTHASGSSFCQCSMNRTTNVEKRSFFYYDRPSVIPYHSTISVTSWKVINATLQPPIIANNCGAYVGVATGFDLANDAPHFNWGTPAFIDVCTYPDQTLINLSDGGIDPTVYFDSLGMVVVIRDEDPALVTGRNFNTVRGNCTLTVDYWYMRKIGGRNGLCI